MISKKTEFCSKLCKCPLCHRLFQKSSYEHHIRGCLYRLELDMDRKEDQKKAKIALDLTKKYFGQKIYVIAKKEFGKWAK